MFQIKVYNRINTVLKKTISPKDLLSDIWFSANLNWWLWDLNFELAYPITDTSISYWDIINISIYNDNNKNWLQIYMWYVTKIWRKQTTTRQTIEITCLWVASLLTDQVTTITLAWATAGSYIKNLIDEYNWLYWDIFIYDSSIEDWPVISDWELDWKYLDIMSNISDRIWYNLFIDWYWKVYFKETSITPTHYLTNKKDLEDIYIEEDLEWLVNSVKVIWEYEILIWWTQKATAYLTETYEDAPSINLYWKKYEEVWLTTGIKNTSWPYLSSYAQQYIIDRKDPKKQTTLVINRQYDLESIKPWDTIKTRNFDYLLDNIKILKLNYSQDKVVLYLDRYISFWKQIINSWN